MNMPFGKYKGNPIRERHMPTDYLKWIYENVPLKSYELFKEIHDELESRGIDIEKLKRKL